MTGARPVIPVAAGCLVNAQGEVLICQRPAGKIAAGKWEFPGGKIETGESPEQALRRELREELGVELRTLRPLVRVRHDYSDRTVELAVWRVERWDGTPRPLDFQGLAWVAPDELWRHDLLAADVPVVRALRLPAHCIFTPPDLDPGSLPGALDALPAALLRVRLPALSGDAYRALAQQLGPVLRASRQRLVLDRDPGDVVRLGADGFHASAAALGSLQSRPVLAGAWFGASCHDGGELEHARTVGADYAVLGPVLATRSHPDTRPLGWTRFADLARNAALPVYAIGGVGPAELATARAHGAHGVAGISAYWRG